MTKTGIPAERSEHDLRSVKTTPPKNTTPRTKTSGLSAAEGLTLEDELIDRSVEYARKNLSL